MKPFMLSTLVLALGLTSSVAGRDLTSTERAALAGQPVSDIAALRAGASAAAPFVAGSERLALARAEESATDLDMLRAVDDHDLTVIAVVLAVVVLAILIF
ncbi:MAG TPA: hypothetical protein VFY71_05350 [Planctomycetota bacterium]|nr:hypothetical protein [Planctomycetota bacterium]